MLIKFLNNTNGKVKATAGVTQLVTRHNRPLLIEISTPAKSVVQGMCAHIFKYRRGQNPVEMDLVINGKHLYAMPGEKFKRIWLKPTPAPAPEEGKKQQPDMLHVCMVSAELSQFSSRAVFAETDDIEVVPPHFLKMLGAVTDVPFLHEWSEYLWREGIRNGRILSGDTLIGSQTIYYLAGDNINTENSWDTIIQRGVADKNLTWRS